ncbi:MAG: hypothetical protein JO266_22750 [Acidobacteria bacterium]|nr:hypothetical protein [Acidobacteriota bacterium]
MKNRLLALAVILLFAIAATGQATPISSTPDEAQGTIAPRSHPSHSPKAHVEHTRGHRKTHRKHHKKA